MGDVPPAVHVGAFAAIALTLRKTSCCGPEPLGTSQYPAHAERRQWGRLCLKVPQNRGLGRGPRGLIFAFFFISMLFYYALFAFYFCSENTSPFKGIGVKYGFLSPFVPGDPNRRSGWSKPLQNAIGRVRTCAGRAHWISGPAP